MVSTNLSATAGSGDWPLNGMLKNLMPAVFAADASPSTSAPFSVGWRRLMIELNPSFLISGTASGLVAPPHATVVSSWTTLIAPGTVGLVYCWAAAAREPRNAMAQTMSERRRTIEESSQPTSYIRGLRPRIYKARLGP